MLRKRLTAKSAEVFHKGSQSFFSLRFYFIFIFLPFSSFSQTDSVPYSPGFHFREGIYRSFTQFRNNDPLPKSKIVSSYDTASIDFVKQVMSGKTFRFIDSDNVVVEEGTGKAWGYSENGAIYVNYNSDFNRIVVIGTICHFTALYTSYMYNTYPGTYSPVYGTPVQTAQQYILDTKTGNILDFNAQNLLTILQRDAELGKEYAGLNKNKRRQMMFMYLRKYNDKYPIWFRK